MTSRTRAGRSFAVRLLACAGLCVVVSCGEATPEGTVGTTDLRQHLPSTVATRASVVQGVTHDAQFDVGQPPARVALHWQSIRDGANQYILSVELEVIRSATGVRIIGPNALNPTLERTADGVIESVPVQVEWIRRGFGRSTNGTVTYRINAAGQAHRL